jgi:hypothetical protein
MHVPQSLRRHALVRHTRRWRERRRCVGDRPRGAECRPCRAAGPLRAAADWRELAEGAEMAASFEELGVWPVPRTGATWSRHFRQV